MDEITLDGKTYVSSKHAAKITGYAKDYIGQLCREGRVEARLVGRNWYVLEESIREHRFGAETAAEEEKAPIQSVSEAPLVPPIAPMAADPVTTAEDPAENAWKSANYTPIEAPALIPTLATEEKKPEINVLDKYAENKGSYGVFNPAPEPVTNSKAIREMQSAWHDWFVRTNELDVSKETLLKNPESSEISSTETKEDEEVVPLHKMHASQEENMTPVSLEKVSAAIDHHYQPSEESFGAEEAVVLHRAQNSSPAPEAQMPEMKSREVRTRSQSSVYSHSELRKDVFLNQHTSEGRVIRERRVKRKKKPSLFVQLVFILIAVSSVIVAAIGSGKFDSVISGSRFDTRAVQFLGGESTVVKTSK